jgi:hypothetical protein
MAWKTARLERRKPVLVDQLQPSIHADKLSDQIYKATDG